MRTVYGWSVAGSVMACFFVGILSGHAATHPIALLPAINNRLTSLTFAAMLFRLSKKTKAGPGIPNYERHSRNQCGFFVPKAQPSIMAGWAEQPKGWPVLVSVCQLRPVRLPMIGIVRGRVYHLLRALIMNNQTSRAKSAQNPANVRPEKSRPYSLFALVIYRHQAAQVLFTGLAFSAAVTLQQACPCSRIKFERMEGLK